jgi:hypothetical protein
METIDLAPTNRTAPTFGKNALDLLPKLLLPCYALGLAIAFVLLPALPQTPDYHRFVDDRSWFGISNFSDVASNLAILLPALLGLALVNHAASRGHMFRTACERTLATTCFAALVLTAIGSTWYHLAPDNTRLFWDRLPLGLAFTALPALLIAERISLDRAGRLMLFLWVLTGPATVLWWQFGEVTGRGDLRPYFMLHAFMFVLPPALLAMRTPYTGRQFYAIAYLLFVLAMAGDRLDHAVFECTHGLVSGHTMKHLLMGLAIGMLAYMFATRRHRQEFPLPHPRA